jgi:hypothetical protein
MQNELRKEKYRTLTTLEPDYLNLYLKDNLLYNAFNKIKINNIKGD